MSEGPMELPGDAEELPGQHDVWIKKLLQGDGVFTLRYGWVNTGRRWQPISRLNADKLARGRHAYGLDTDAHLIALLLDGGTLRVRHAVEKCHRCSPEQDQ